MNVEDIVTIEVDTFCLLDLTEDDEIAFDLRDYDGSSVTLTRDHIIAIAKHFKLTEGDLV